MRKRSLSRQVAMKTLFQSSLVETDVDEALDFHREDMELDEEVLSFARKLIEGAQRHSEEIDDLIDSHLQNWTPQRVGNVERAIMRMAVFELLHCDEIPPRVTLNEAVMLAKDFGAEGAGRFVNGILNRLARSVRPSDFETQE